MTRTRLKAADLFCGAGGFTTGALQAGVDVVLAVNHWRTAIYTHESNHPETRHICARISDIDIKHDRTLPDLDMILASPECTHHSIARGGRPVCDQRRSTPWNVLDWVEAKLPRWLIVENVREFRDWGPIAGTYAETRRRNHSAGPGNYDPGNRTQLRRTNTHRRRCGSINQDLSRGDLPWCK